MAIVTTDDVIAELPTLKLSTTTVPSLAQVTTYITEIEQEVQARLLSCSAPYPPDGTPAAQFLKRTILEGVRWMTLRAKYTLSAANSQSPDIDRAYKAYMDRLGVICDVARSVAQVMDTQTGQAAPARTPQVAHADLGPNLSSSFGEWTQAVDTVDQMRTAQRWTGNRPWPLQ